MASLGETKVLIQPVAPESAVIVPLEEQLVVIPASDTRRFVVCEMLYGRYYDAPTKAYYNVRGYATIDRQTGKPFYYVESKHSGTINGVYDNRVAAEDDCNWLNEHPDYADATNNKSHHFSLSLHRWIEKKISQFQSIKFTKRRKTTLAPGSSLI